MARAPRRGRARAAGQTGGTGRAGPGGRHGADQRHRQERDQRCPDRARARERDGGRAARTARRAQRSGRQVRIGGSAGRHLHGVGHAHRIRAADLFDRTRDPAVADSRGGRTAGRRDRLRAGARGLHHRTHHGRRRHAVRGRRRRLTGDAVRKGPTRCSRSRRARPTIAESSGSSAWPPASTT